MIVQRIVLALVASLAATGLGAEPGDELQGPWRGSLEDSAVGTVAVELTLWRQGPSVLRGLIRYEGGTCIKTLVQVAGPRIPEFGDQQPVWFQDRRDPPDPNCGVFEETSRILIRRSPEKPMGMAQRALQVARLELGSIKVLSEGNLQPWPNTPEMDRAARAEFQKGAAAPAPAQVAAVPSPLRERLVGSWAGMASRPTGGTAPVELQIWLDGDRLSGLALYPSSRCVGVLTQHIEGSAVVKFIEDAPVPGTICPSGSSVTASPGNGDTLQWGWSGPPGSTATASGTFTRAPASESLKAALRERGIVLPSPAQATAAPATPAPGAKPAGKTTVDILLGEPSRVPNTRDPIAWLAQFAAVDAEALGIANLTLYFTEEPADARKPLDLAVEIARRERFTVPGLDTLAQAATQLVQDFGGDTTKSRPIDALSSRRNSVLQVMEAALVRREPEATQRYRGLQNYLRSTPYLRSAVRFSSQQAQMVLTLNRNGARLAQIARNDNGQRGLAARLALVTTEQIEMIVRSTTHEKAVAAYRQYDNTRRGVAASYMVQQGLDAMLKSIGDMKMCSVTSEPVDAPHCGADGSGGLSCTRPVMNCPP